MSCDLFDTENQHSPIYRVFTFLNARARNVKPSSSYRRYSHNNRTSWFREFKQFFVLPFCVVVSDTSYIRGLTSIWSISQNVVHPTHTHVDVDARDSEANLNRHETHTQNEKHKIRFNCLSLYKSICSSTNSQLSMSTRENSRTGRNRSGWVRFVLITPWMPWPPNWFVTFFFFFFFGVHTICRTVNSRNFTTNYVIATNTNISSFSITLASALWRGELN